VDKPLLVFAMEEESQDVFSDYEVLHTGIGKVNAAYGLMRYLHGARPSLVVNMGTAGSRKHSGGVVLNPVSFVQRDMDVTILGFDKFQTPFSSDPQILHYGHTVPDLPQGICGTGDNFDVSPESAQFDVVDMEAYALALICQREKIPFLCLKYISDGANDDSHKDWNEALHDTAEKLRRALKEAGL
jgi:adenosylhomocysteine nucleosidase